MTQTTKEFAVLNGSGEIVETYTTRITAKDRVKFLNYRDNKVGAKDAYKIQIITKEVQ